MTDQLAQAIMVVGALVRVGSSLLARRLPFGQTLRLILIWVGIFGGVFVLFLFRDEGRAVWQRATAELSGGGGRTVGRTFVIARSADGHFWAAANVNGHAVRFLVDSGATTTTLSRDDAAAADVAASGGFPVLVETANGTVTLQRARISLLEVGPIAITDAPVLIGSEGLGSVSLLGMSFLSTLSSWRVEGTTLILQP